MHALYFNYSIYICASLFNMKSMSRITFGFCLFCLLCLSSCSYYNYTYIQTPVSTPNLTEAGDLKIQGSVNPRGFNAEVAYSPIKHLGVLVNATSGLVKT